MISKRTAFAALAALAASGPAHADVTISTAATQNMNCSGGVCAPTATDATLNVSDLENLLASRNVEVTTTGTGVQANNIRAKAKMSWQSASTLTLDAYQSIRIEWYIAVPGSGGMSVVTNDGGTGGTFSFVSKGRVSFGKLSSPFTINGASYTLVKSVASLASAIAANPSGDYALAEDYDASKDGTYSRSPIATTFAGRFNGLGNTISSLTIVSVKSEDTVGLFSTIASGASVSSLNVSNVNISVSELTSAGAVAGGNYGMIFNDSADGSIFGGKAALLGGLVGASGSVSVVDLSHAAVDESGGEDELPGGLVGSGDGQITRSYATGKIANTNKGAAGGGLIGKNVGSIEDCYSLGDVEAANVSGGFVGVNYYSASIATSYSTGSVSNRHAGGFAGGNVGTVQSAYWDITTSGKHQGVNEGSETGITGLKDAKLKSGLPPGFDPAVWAQSGKINNGYPYLIDNPPPM